MAGDYGDYEKFVSQNSVGVDLLFNVQIQFVTLRVVG